MFGLCHAARVIKINRDAAHLNVAAAGVQIVGVVPAVFMQRALNQRLSEEKLHLRLGHAGLKLLNHFARDEVALVHVGPVNIAVEVTAGGKCGSGSRKDNKGCAQRHSV